MCVYTQRPSALWKAVMSLLHSLLRKIRKLFIVLWGSISTIWDKRLACKQLEVEGGRVLKGAIRWALRRQRLILEEVELFGHWPQTTVSFPISLSELCLMLLALWLPDSLEFRTKLKAKSSSWWWENCCPWFPDNKDRSCSLKMALKWASATSI